jgi:hypothetical protein
MMPGKIGLRESMLVEFSVKEEENEFYLGIAFGKPQYKPS